MLNNWGCKIIKSTVSQNITSWMAREAEGEKMEKKKERKEKKKKNSFKLQKECATLQIQQLQILEHHLTILLLQQIKTCYRSTH